MSFVTMDDKSYIDGLIGVYELNNVSLLRGIFMDSYLASAANCKTVYCRQANWHGHRALPSTR